MRERILSLVVLCILVPGLSYIGIVFPGYGVGTLSQHVPYSSMIPLTNSESILIILGGMFILFVLYNIIVEYFLGSPDGDR